MDLSGTFSRIPTWGWAAGGVLIVGALFLSNRSSGTSVQSNAVPAADVNDILNQLQDAANQIPGAAGKTTTITKTTTVQEKSLWGSDIPSSIKSRLSSESAATLFKRYGVSYGSSINMPDLKRLLRRMHVKYGEKLTYTDLVRAGVVKSLPTTSSTSTTSTVQSSNNEVTT